MLSQGTFGASGSMLADMAWDMAKSELLLQGFHLKNISQADSVSSMVLDPEFSE